MTSSIDDVKAARSFACWSPTWSIRYHRDHTTSQPAKPATLIFRPQIRSFLAELQEPDRWINVPLLGRHKSWKENSVGIRTHTHTEGDLVVRCGYVRSKASVPAAPRALVHIRRASERVGAVNWVAQTFVAQFIIYSHVFRRGERESVCVCVCERV